MSDTRDAATRGASDFGPSILVRLPNWIGDAVMAAPAILGLSEVLPDASITLLGKPAALALFEGLDDPFRFQTLPPDVSRADRLLEAAAHARGEHHDAVLVLPPSFSAAAMALAAGIPIRVGWPTEGRGLLLTARSQAAVRTRPLRDQYCQLAEDLVLELTGKRPTLDPRVRRLPLRAEELEGAAARMSALEVDGPRAIGLAPGAIYGPTKRWPESHFLTLANELQRLGNTVFWLGGAEERELCRRLHDASTTTGPSVFLAGELSLRESLGLIARLAAVVSNDSGALHLADAAGTPVVGIYGSTEPRWTGPGGPFTRALTLRLACAPCFQRHCPTAIECLRDLTVDSVVAALAEVRGALSRRNGERAVFLDRDGTLIELVPYLVHARDVRLAPRAGEALRLLAGAGFRLVLVTNQSALARGLMDRAGLRRVHSALRDLLAREGVTLEAIEVCPHHPEFTGSCACRKPAPGLLLRAAHRLDLDLVASWMVGDTHADVEAGTRAGARSALLRTGYGRETETGSRGVRVFDDLFEFASGVVAEDQP